MKRLLTIACVLFALAGAGQKDTTVTNFDTTAILLYNPISIYYDSIPKPKYDTIPIIYLYSDTSKFESFGREIYISSVAMWDFGYEVVEGRILWRIGNDGSRTPLFNHISYLDHHKQPIRKSIIVWQVKNIQ